MRKFEGGSKKSRRTKSPSLEDCVVETTIFPSCPFVYVVSAAGGVNPQSPDGVLNSIGTGGAGDKPRVSVPCRTTTIHGN
jgi:hypothetical protein